MRMEQVACQMVAFSKEIQTLDGLAAACRRVKEIGYDAVQISGIYDAPFTGAEIKAVCDQAGLVIAATHERWDTILEQPERIAPRLAEQGTVYTAYPYPHGFDMSDLDAVKRMISQLNHAATVIADAGAVLTYHNHTLEFVRHGERSVFEMIVEESVPALQFELDVYWCHRGGALPLAWIERLAGRLPLIHLADYKVSTDLEPEIGCLGDGNLNLGQLIDAADAAGCRWFIVEHWNCPYDPDESVANSLAYLQRHVAAREVMA